MFSLSVSVTLLPPYNSYFASKKYTLKKLSKKKTYYVKVRAYRIDSTGKMKYGKYTSVSKVKINK